MNRYVARVPLLMALLALSTALSCTNPIATAGSTPGGDTSASLPATADRSTGGTLELFLKDFPLGDRQVTSVWVTIRSVEAHGEASGWTTVFASPQGTEYDLLKLSDDVAHLSSTQLTPDLYTQVRLVLGSFNRITLAGSGDYPLTIPSGEQTGIKIVGEFDIKEGTATTLVLDFDAQRSVKIAGKGKYQLKPVIRIENVIYTPVVSENQAPVAVFNDPPITGSAAIGGQLTASYSFSDPDGDLEGSSKFQWYRFTSSTAVSGGEAIAGATEKSYTTVDLSGNSDSGKWLRVQVIPVDLPGAEGTPVLSGPVRVYTRVVIDTFMPKDLYQNDTYLTLLDATGKVVTEDDNGNPDQANHNLCSRIDWQAGLPSGVLYYIKVNKLTDIGNPNYAIRLLDYDPGAVFPAVVGVSELSDNDNALGTDGLPLTPPVEISVAQVISRSIYPELTDNDWFTFTLP